MGSLPGKGTLLTFADSPHFSSHQTKGDLLNVNPTYKKVLFLQEKLKNLKLLIDCQKSSIALWEAQMPKYELLSKVREELARNEKILREVTEVQPCQ